MDLTEDLTSQVASEARVAPAESPQLTLHRIFCKHANRSRSAVWALDAPDGLRINVARAAAPAPDQGWRAYSVYTRFESAVESSQAKAWAERQGLDQLRTSTLREICELIREIYRAEPARLR